MFLALVGTFTVLTAPTRAAAAPRATVNPVIFVHGQEGSAQQWQSQAKRFSGNGYRDDLLYVHEYDTSVATDDHAIAGLEELVDAVLARTGARQVDLLAHSRGTRVAQAYLSAPERAAEVAKYVNLDGRTAASPPGGVPTLAIWSSLQPNGSIGGALNVHEPQAGHTESATSAESFAHVYTFLRGRPPLTTRVLPEAAASVEIMRPCRALPAEQGARRTPGGVAARPRHRRPRRAAPGARRPDRRGRGLRPARSRPTRTLRTGVRPARRAHRPLLLRTVRARRPLRTSARLAPGGVADSIDVCPGQTALTVVRAREWRAGTADDDRLRIAGADVLNPAVSPQLRQILGLFAFDKGCDGVSHLDAALPPFDRVPFLTATDLSLPADERARGTIPVTQTMRGAGRVDETLAVPNWPSDRHTVSLLFKDYVDIPSGG